MAYKDRIYDITAWDMSKRLEWFLNKICGADDGVIKKTGQENIRAFSDCGFKEFKIQTLGKKIKFFCEKELKGRECYKEISKMMEEINNNRIEIVHPKEIVPIVPFLDRDKFEKLQKTCFELEGKIKRFNEKVRIKEVLPTLEYDMGNAGDIIKHGLLVEFIEWWGRNKPRPTPDSMKIADTFAGCPWDNMSEKISNRLSLKPLKSTRLSVIQNKSPVTDTYMGSSLLMFKAAGKHNIHIDVSDKDKDAQCNWRNVTMEYKDKINQSIKLIYPGLDKDDGYNILDSKYAKKYDLILLDPYSDFLRNEFYSSFKSNHRPKHFSKILDLVKNNKNLFIAVFVLDMKSTNAVGKWYADFKENELRKFTFSLRCPKIPRENTKINGESGFDSEILLISQQIANRKCDELRKGLIDFAEKVTNALPLSDDEKVEFWPPHE